jgi:hypothetical protein
MMRRTRLSDNLAFEQLLLPMLSQGCARWASNMMLNWGTRVMGIVIILGLLLAWYMV